MDAVFSHLSSHNRLPKLHQLVIAPFQLHDRMLALIAQVGEAAARGEDARIVLKMNALTDELLMQALVRAGQQGSRRTKPGLTDGARFALRNAEDQEPTEGLPNDAGFARRR
jgi:hypothetical protein